MNQQNKPEPAGQETGGADVWDLVVEDMRDRQKLGLAKYGKAVQAFDGRDPLIDAYQEVLDTAVYLRKAIEQNRLRAAREKGTSGVHDEACKDPPADGPAHAVRQGG